MSNNRKNPGGNQKGKNRLSAQRQPASFLRLPTLSPKIPACYKLSSHYAKIKENLGLGKSDPLEKIFDLLKHTPSDLYEPDIDYDMQNNIITVTSADSHCHEIGPIFTNAEKLFPALGAAAVWAIYEMPMKIFTAKDFYDIMVWHEWRGCTTSKEYMETSLEECYPEHLEEYKRTGKMPQEIEDEMISLPSDEMGNTSILPDTFTKNVDRIFHEAPKPDFKKLTGPPEIVAAIMEIEQNTQKMEAYKTFVDDKEDNEDTAYYSAMLMESFAVDIIPYAFENHIQQGGIVLSSPLHINLTKKDKKTSVIEVIKTYLDFAALTNTLIDKLHKLNEDSNENHSVKRAA